VKVSWQVVSAYQRQSDCAAEKAHEKNASAFLPFSALLFRLTGIRLATDLDLNHGLQHF
jgi:hypothetical protein